MLSSTIDITMYNGMGVHSTAIDLPVDSLGFVGFVDYPTTGSAYLDGNDPTQVIYESEGVVGADSFEFTYLDSLGGNQSYFVNVTTVADPMMAPPSSGGVGSGTGGGAGSSSSGTSGAGTGSGSGGYSGSTGGSSGSTSPGAVSPTSLQAVVHVPLGVTTLATFEYPLNEPDTTRTYILDPTWSDPGPFDGFSLSQMFLASGGTAAHYFRNNGQVSITVYGDIGGIDRTFLYNGLTGRFTNGDGSAWTTELTEIDGQVQFDIHFTVEAVSLSDYAATIDWGDGATGIGTVVADGLSSVSGLGRAKIVGNHTFETIGLSQVNINLTGPGIYGPNATPFYGNAKVFNLPVTVVEASGAGSGSGTSTGTGSGNGEGTGTGSGIGTGMGTGTSSVGVVTVARARLKEWTYHLDFEFKADLPDHKFSRSAHFEVFVNGIWKTVGVKTFLIPVNTPEWVRRSKVNETRFFDYRGVDIQTLMSGDYTARVSFSVLDSNLFWGLGSTAETLSKEFIFTVEDTPPVISAPDGGAGYWWNQTYGGTFRASSYLRGSDIVSEIRIDWGDGTGDIIVGDIGEKWHTYSMPGKYVVEVEAQGIDSVGYLGYYVEVEQFSRPPSPPAFASPQGGNDVVELLVTLPYNSVITWDLNDDRIFGDSTGGFDPRGLDVLLIRQADGYFVANAKVTDVTGSMSETRYQFVDAGSVVGVRDETPHHKPTTTPDGFNVNIALEIIEQLRPDIYKWWTTKGGVIEKEHTQGWLTGWFYSDVWAYPDRTSGVERPWLRLHSGFSAGEAAQHIIEQVESGYWYSAEFQADQIFQGGDDFGTVEAFAKWQQWYVRECAKYGRLAYQTVSSWYTFQLVGAEFVMTAVDAGQNGLNWTHALDVIGALPFLSKLEIPVSIRHTDGTEIGKVIKKADGSVQFIRAGAGLYNIVDIFPTARRILDVPKTMLSQLTHNRCGHTCVEMLLKDWGIDPKLWTQALKYGDVGTSSDDLMALLRTSIGTGGNRLTNMKK